MKMRYYEVLWYRDPDLNDPYSLEFKTRKQALKYYEDHKNDPDKYGFWVTKRDEDGDVMEDIII